jgi:hypothetical protein
VHALNRLDPDLRAALAAHPIIVTIDNHDLDGRDSGVSGTSRQAALEWIPQRYSIKNRSSGVAYVDTLRVLRLGMVDLIMTDTWTFNGDPWAGGGYKGRGDNLLGDEQVAWLDTVLPVSAREARWRMFSSTKTFMPFTTNAIGAGLGPFLAVVWFALASLLALCCMLEQRRLRPAIGKGQKATVAVDAGSPTAASTGREPAQADKHEALEAEADVGVPSSSRLAVESRKAETTTAVGDGDGASGNSAAVGASCPSRAANAAAVRARLACKAANGAAAQARLAHRSAPRALRFCTMCGVGWVVAWTVIAVAIGIYVFVMRRAGELRYLNASKNTWEGNPLSRARMFDQLERHGADSNNVMLTGDMHFTTAADLAAGGCSGALRRPPASSSPWRCQTPRGSRARRRPPPGLARRLGAGPSRG